MMARSGKPRHKNANSFAFYFEKTLLPENDPNYLEPRQVKQILEMPEATYYKYKKEYECFQRETGVPKASSVGADTVHVISLPVMPASWEDYYRRYIAVLQDYLVYVNENMDVYDEAMVLIKKTKLLLGRTGTQAPDVLEYYGSKLELMHKKLNEYMVTNNISVIVGDRMGGNCRE